MIAAKFVWPDTARHGAVPDLRPAAPAARQRHAVRLAARGRHGPHLLPRAAPVRREAVEREARRRHGGALERRSCWARSSRSLAGWNQGLEYAELPLRLDVLVVVAWIMFGVNIFVTIATRKYTADVRLALVHHGHDPLDRLRLPDRQLRRRCSRPASTRRT